MKRKLYIISTVCIAFLMLFFLAPFHSRQSSNAQISQVTAPKAKKSTDESKLEESFYGRNRDYIESLPKASVHTLETLKKEPKRELVNLPNVGEVIRITFEDGSVGYEPNIATYDVSSGTFGPKPF